MAQVVYDQHPLGDYLKDEAGEQASSMTMPGGDNPVASEAEYTTETDTASHDVFDPLVSVLRRVSHTIMLLSRQTAHREFAERFTHAVVLSPLLIDTSTTNSTPLPHHPLALPEQEHEDTPVVPIHAWPLAAALLVVATLLAGGLTSACVIAIIAGLAHATNVAPEHHARRVLAVACGKLRSSGWLGEWEDDPAPVMLSALDRCVQATSAWDTVVTEAVALLESEERTLFYGSSPRAPSAATSALRIALTSELNTAINTTDTLRALFAPLTQPAALAPLAAMYAPPTSPPPVRVRSHARYASIGAGPRGMDASPSPSFPGTGGGSKRSTWGPGIGGGGAFSSGGGNYGGSLGLGRRRTSAHLRRSRLATPDRAMGVPLPVDEDEDITKAASDAGEDSVRLAPLPQFASDSEAASTPRTPPRRSRTAQSPLSIGLGTPGSGTFGSAALSALRRTSNTPIQTTSLAAIRHSLNVARASRRHTAAHLMALRFTDGDGEYWEDVRSVMGLLSAGMEDAAARLSAAVEGTKEGEGESVIGSEGLGATPSLVGIVSPLSAGFGFAPTIPPRERFAMHVRELVGAAGRAKDLAGSLFQSQSKVGAEMDGFVSSPEDMEAAPAFPLSIEEEEARLEAVRRELGTALRQLERARAVLRAQRVRKDGDGGAEAEAEDSDVPALDRSPSSPASSEKMDEFTPLDIARRQSIDSTLESAHVRPDDASAYLLLATSARDLPPPGIEQVFEADPEDVGVAVKRPRSTLSRAERIAAARSKRVVSSPLPKSGSSTGTGENWGPGGDVVQELKAVISEVGTRRRRAADLHSQAQPQVQAWARTQAPVRGALPQLDLSLAAGLSPPVEIEGERL